jgi:REP element-mobilizing transposase RayT
MAVRLQQQCDNGIYFISFTCYSWISLFEIANTYHSIYTWFDHLRRNNSSIIGYVIMPNHLHLLTHLPTGLKTVNRTVGNAKRLLAYDIIKNLELQKQEDLLQQLYDAVTPNERKKGQRYKVFQESFDAKLCPSTEFVRQKLNYIHYNPVRGRWNLAPDFTLYPHSSAGYYYNTNINAYKDIVSVDEVKEM